MIHPRLPQYKSCLSRLSSYEYRVDSTLRLFLWNFTIPSSLPIKPTIPKQWNRVRVHNLLSETSRGPQWTINLEDISRGNGLASVKLFESLKRAIPAFIDSLLSSITARIPITVTPAKWRTEQCTQVDTNHPGQSRNFANTIARALAHGFEKQFLFHASPGELVPRPRTYRRSFSRN